MRCCGTGLADFSCGIAGLLPRHPWANTRSHHLVKLRAHWLRAPRGEPGRIPSRAAELPWHRAMFSLSHSTRQILSPKSNIFFKKIVLCK